MRPKGFDLDLEGKIEDEESVYPKNIIFPKNSGPFYGLKVKITWVQYSNDSIFSTSHMFIRYFLRDIKLKNQEVAMRKLCHLD